MSEQQQSDSRWFGDCSGRESATERGPSEVGAPESVIPLNSEQPVTTVGHFTEDWSISPVSVVGSVNEPIPVEVTGERRYLGAVQANRVRGANSPNIVPASDTEFINRLRDIGKTEAVEVGNAFGRVQALPTTVEGGVGIGDSYRLVVDRQQACGDMESSPNIALGGSQVPVATGHSRLKLENQLSGDLLCIGGEQIGLLPEQGLAPSRGAEKQEAKNGSHTSPHVDATAPRTLKLGSEKRTTERSRVFSGEAAQLQRPSIYQWVACLSITLFLPCVAWAATGGFNAGPTIKALPQSVYDDIANPAVPTINVTPGRYYLPTAIEIERDDLILDFQGSGIYAAPNALVEAVWKPFVVQSEPITFQASPFRQPSQLTGEIDAGTTELEMHASEIVDVEAGEDVLIWAGVDTSDPAEPYRFIHATVDSVDGTTITFAAPLGFDVPTYASEAALEAVVSPALHYKIGTWGVDYGENYHKGLGFDHGLMRYVDGNRTDNVTIKNLAINVTMPTSTAQIPNAGNAVAFFIRDTEDITLENISANNIVGDFIFQWRSKDLTVNRAYLTGRGIQNIFSNVTYVGHFYAGWGGENLTFNDIYINGTNLSLTETEINPGNMRFQNVLYDVNFDGTLTYQPVNDVPITSFSSATFGYCEINNWDCSVTGSDTFFASGFQLSPMTLDNFTLHTDAGTLLWSLSLGDPAAGEIEYTGDINIDDLNFGEFIEDTETTVVPSGQWVRLPQGLYRYARFRVTVQGNSSRAYGTPADWTDLDEDAWENLRPIADSAQAYVDETEFFMQWSGGSAATLEWEVGYWPLDGGTGWELETP
jgi:hypothetical protein